MTCDHLDTIASVPPPATVCEDCIAAGEHDWVNLRQCLECGGTRCCDSSPRTHATRHNQATGHPLIRSAMAGQDWLWCYACEARFGPSKGGFVRLDGR